MQRALRNWLLVFVLALCSPAVAEEISIVHYGGVSGKVYKETMFDPGGKELGITIRDTSRTDMAKIKAMVNSGRPEWDVAVVNTLEVGRGAREHLWEKIDWKAIDPKVTGQAGALEYGVPFVGFAIGLAYNAKDYPDPSKAPKSWADFWDVKKFPGPRTLENRVRYQLEFALLADGVAPDKLYPLDVDRAFRKLDEIKPHIVTWANPPVQPLELLMRGEVVMAPVLSGVVYDATKRGANVSLVWNQALFVTNSWSVLKGTSVPLAMKFIKVMMQPEYQARMAEVGGDAPMNPQALALIKPEVQKWLVTSPSNFEKTIVFNNDWWAENEAALISRWTKWLATR